MTDRPAIWTDMAVGQHLVWTTSTVLLAAELRAKGYKYAEIANALGTTKNSVIGRLWRHEKAARRKLRAPSAPRPLRSSEL